MLVVSNATDGPLTIWIEPWCDELTLPPRSVLSLAADIVDGDVADIETADDRLIVWALAAGTMTVAIDGIEQDTASRRVALPSEMLCFSVKGFVNTVFAAHSAARAGGAPDTRSRSSRLSRRLTRSLIRALLSWIRLVRSH